MCPFLHNTFENITLFLSIKSSLNEHHNPLLLGQVKALYVFSSVSIYAALINKVQQPCSFINATIPCCTYWCMGENGLYPKNNLLYTQVNPLQVPESIIQSIFTFEILQVKPFKPDVCMLHDDLNVIIFFLW